MGSSSEAALFAPPDVVAEPAGDGLAAALGGAAGRLPGLGDPQPAGLGAPGPGPPARGRAGPDGSWRTCTYGEAAAAAESIGQALLDLGLGPGRPLLILSGNGVDHLLMTLGAMTAGIPAAPVSVAYSLQSRDHARIRAVTSLISPGAVFADDAGRFAAALDAAGAVPAIVATGRPAGGAAAR